MPPRRKKDPPSFKPSAETLKNFQMPADDGELEALPSGPRRGTIEGTYTGECRALNEPAVLPPPPEPVRTEQRPSASRFWTSFAAAASRATKKKSGDAQHWAPARPPPPPPDRRAGKAKKKVARPKLRRGLSDEGRAVFNDSTKRSSDSDSTAGRLSAGAFPSPADFAASAAADARRSSPPRFSWDDQGRSSSKSLLSESGSMGARHSLAQQGDRSSRNWQQYHVPAAPGEDPLEVPADFSWAAGMHLGSFADDDGIDLGPLDLSN